MVRLLTVMAAGMLAALAGDRAMAEEWKEYKFDEAGFKISFPGEPGRVDKGKNEFGEYEFIALPGDTEFSVWYIDQPKSVAEKPAAELKRLGKVALDSRKLESVKETPIKLGKHPGLEIVAKRGDERNSQFRLWLVGNRLFTALVTSAKPPDEKDVKKFFESFEVVE